MLQPASASALLAVIALTKLGPDLLPLLLPWSLVWFALRCVLCLVQIGIVCGSSAAVLALRFLGQKLHPAFAAATQVRALRLLGLLLAAMLPPALCAPASVWSVSHVCYSGLCCRASWLEG